ncbi:Mrp/NBP35 family ATP-binding protein [Pseudokineococcus lusitanus]|uniref:Iron-sulfur cluster carrier protein n=1 Tax=Pseudokineococcus lusitanus TaxID=763993 RepID=A0A3N1HN85_9ACTN|nr:P-loop NTPase [Pseudokineococcus lusitanus]ROP43935.1 ATP-binding protein involved in chromosome partitioning [Pseudokineococcus lusitanus]
MSGTARVGPPPAPPSVDEVREALGRVQDPEIRRPVTELGMVRDVEVVPGAPGGGATVRVGLLLTTSGCPLKDRLTEDTTREVGALAGVDRVEVDLGVMDDAGRAALKDVLRGGRPAREVPFSRPGSLTRVVAVASGKGGVGKSSVTVNLAAAMAADGLRVGVLDADVHGFSVPRMLGVQHAPTQIDDMIVPPVAHGVKVVSIGMFTPGNTPVVWRGPMLHRTLEQFLTDVHWGDLDVLLLDLPPGTGDIAISVAQLLPGAELLVVTTPQAAAAEVAERAGTLARQTKQAVAGVVENMSWLETPDGGRLEVFGRGGGQAVVDRLGEVLRARVTLLAQVPLDVRVREGGDEGVPLVLSAPDAPAARALREVARALSGPRGLAGRPLGLTPVRRAG